MKIYFFYAETRDHKLRQATTIIKELLEREGILVITPETAANFSEDEFSSTGNLIETVDGVIMEASLPHQELGYLLAYTVLQKKPTLCLYTKSNVIKNLQRYLATQKQTEFLYFEHYSPGIIEKVLNKFLAQIAKPTAKDDIPKIKFTLRLTPRIEKYLEWKTHNTKMTKAEFLREEIKNKLITKDEDYQKYFKRREGRGEQ